MCNKDVEAATRVTVDKIILSEKELGGGDICDQFIFSLQISSLFVWPENFLSSTFPKFFRIEVNFIKI